MEELIYESHGYCKENRLMRYNRTRLRKPHKCRVFADFVQTKTQGIRRQIDQIHRKGRFAIRIQKDSVSENCHRGPGHSDYRPGFLLFAQHRRSLTGSNLSLPDRNVCCIINMSGVRKCCENMGA